MSFGLAVKAFWKTLTDGQTATRVKDALQPPAIEVKDEGPSPEPLRMLALLQRDARLLDFLTEDISDYDDEQVGAAVRDIHRDSKATLDKYVTLGPVLDKEEDESYDVPEGFDPGSIRLTGQVKGEPPFKGTVVHRGWKITELKLPEPPEQKDKMVLAPAEVTIE